MFCGYFRFETDGMNRAMDGAAISIAKLAASLPSLELKRTIIDRTGLIGVFDVHLKWVIDGPASNAGAGMADGPVGVPPPNPTGPSILTALQEQLGLKLEPAQGPVEVLVIDRVAKPSEN